MLSNLKIKVGSEAESKEAQELFFELGAKWKSQLNRSSEASVINVGFPSIFLYGDSMALNWRSIEHFNEDTNFKEITLPQIRDLVVLKRNDVGDATHKGSITDNAYYVSSDEEVYRLESSAWCFSTVIVADLKPIKNSIKDHMLQVKEWLDPNENYSYHKCAVIAQGSGWIEIPEGCNIITCENRKGNIIYFHWKYLDSDEFFLKDEKIWSNNFGETLSDFIEKNEGSVVIIWSRHTITKEPIMKEFLEPMPNGDYRYHKDDGLMVGGDWIEIPSVDCNCAVIDSKKGVIFSSVKNDIHYLKSLPTFLCVVWQRRTTLEELPFVDDEPYNPDYDGYEEDTVNHPPHYASSSIECIDAMRAMLTPEQFVGYLRGNIFKYQWRYENKGGIQDLEKSQWYLNRLLSILQS